MRQQRVIEKGVVQQPGVEVITDRQHACHYPNGRAARRAAVVVV